MITLLILTTSLIHLFYMVGRMHSLNLGVKGLIGWPIIEKSVRDRAAGVVPG